MSNESNTPPVPMMPPAHVGPAAPMMPQLYVNGFKAACSTSDVFVVVQHNGNDIAILNMSFTLAKTLGESLQKLIEQLEKKSGQEIMTAEIIGRAMGAQAEQKIT